LLQEELAENPSEEAALNLKLAQNYITADRYSKMAGWDWAKNYTRESMFGRLDLSGLALNEILQFEHHPLYHRAMWAMGKLSFWGWIEQHGPRQLLIAKRCFKYLEKYYPDNSLLKMYMGQQIPFREDFEYNDTDPKWAQSASHALQNILEIIHYWVQYRQAANGEFGGKFDDDVEMLRWWPIGSLVAGDSITLLGMTRLVDGMWHSGWLVNGFSKRVLDVEHSAEPVADTQPMMIGIDYGNPIYVERCMESIQGLNLWTGINEKGHRHFKSSWYSATEIDQAPPKDCDVPMNTRTVKAARWLAWYNRHPVAMKFLREWGDAWLEDCLRTDKGKPYGIVPSAIRYHDDAIGGHADNWHHPGLFWSYYDFHGGIDMLQQFLSNYLLFDDPKYLEPIELAIQLAEKYYSQDLSDARIGSEKWVARIFHRSLDFANLLEQWRLITGNNKYDDFLLKIGSHHLKYRLTGNEKYLVEGCAPIIDATIMNRELITTEAYFTDRIYLKNIHQGYNWGAQHLEAMFTGKALLNGFFPFSDVIWRNMGDKFASVVTESSPQSLQILAYNLDNKPLTGEMLFWNLLPGKYVISQGPDVNKDNLMDRVDSKMDLYVTNHSASSPVTLPVGKMQVINIDIVSKRENKEPFNLADLAISKKDIRIEYNDNVVDMIVPVHNIGLTAANNFKIILTTGSGNELRNLITQQIKNLSAPLDLKPRIVEIPFSFSTSDLSSDITITVNPAAEIPEITTKNNSVTIHLTRLGVKN